MLRSGFLALDITDTSQDTTPTTNNENALSSTKQYGITETLLKALEGSNENLILWLCEHYTETIDWERVSNQPGLPESFIQTYQNELNKHTIWEPKPLSKEFKIKMKNKSFIEKTESDTDDALLKEVMDVPIMESDELDDVT